MVNYYECISCNYKTKDRSNLYNHNKTKKHLKNTTILNASIFPPIQLPYTSHISNQSVTKNQLQCQYCDRVFTRYDNLGRHMKSCETKNKQNKDNNLKKQLYEYDHKFELLNCKLNEYEKNVTYHTEETQHYKDEAKYYKHLLMEAGGLVKKSVSALTYSITNYDDAPSIKTISTTNIDEFNRSDIKIANDIISAYKHKTLNKYLGDIIIKEYKKNKPKDQSIWNTDDTRLTYIIKELIQNNSSNWIVDKKGIKTTIYLIDPLLKHVKSLIIMYQKNMDVGETVFEMEVHMENSKIIKDLVMDIDNNITSKEVLKYISSHLRFNENNLKQII